MHICPRKLCKYKTSLKKYLNYSASTLYLLLFVTLLWANAMAHIQGVIYDLGQCSITGLHRWPSCLFLNKIGVILF